jgi:hypothetical protein
VVHFATYNPVVAADRIQDLATVVAWARLQPDVREVSLVGQDIAGLQVLLARPLLDGLARTVVDLGELPDPLAAGVYPAPLDLPGIFQFGGWNAAAALSAPAPLWLYGDLSRFDGTWARAVYGLSGADHLLRLDSRRPGADEIAEWLDGGD